jgi:hypothetical protein
LRPKAQGWNAFAVNELTWLRDTGLLVDPEQNQIKRPYVRGVVA